MIFKQGEIVQHLNGVELIVKKSNEVVTTCEYLHEKDYIQSKFMGVKSVTKVAICLTCNLRRTTNEQLTLWKL